MKKLYVLVRRDLSPSQQAVQAGHAVAEFLLNGFNSTWDNGTLIYLGVKNLLQLEKWMYKLKENNISYVSFYEPDIGNQPTALATDQGSELMKGLNLL